MVTRSYENSVIVKFQTPTSYTGQRGARAVRSIQELGPVQNIGLAHLLLETAKEIALLFKLFSIPQAHTVTFFQVTYTNEFSPPQ